jgi:type I restriction enzyme R subunit
MLTLNIKDRFNLFDDPRIADIASKTLLESEQLYGYKIYTFIIMPDHLHVLFLLNGKLNISRIVQLYKTFVYHKVASNIGLKDKFWQKSFDYRIKDSWDLFEKAITYIKNNPLKWNLPKQYFCLPYFFISTENLNNSKNLF